MERPGLFTAMFYFFIFIIGLSVGSFLNVVIFRLETGESIVFQRSHCRQCGAVLRWYDLIPLLSFALALGKCRYCGRKINWQYPAVEIATGLLFLLIFDISNLFIACYLLLITCFLIIIFVYDLKRYIIPDKIIYPAILIAFLFNLFNYGLRITNYGLLSYFLAAILASSFFLSLVLISKGKWMGAGDVKLAFLMGLVLGWPNILTALFLAFLFGAIVGVALIIFGKKGLKSQIPFGPFLAGATILVMLFGGYIEKLFFF